MIGPGAPSPNVGPTRQPLKGPSTLTPAPRGRLDESTTTNTGTRNQVTIVNTLTEPKLAKSVRRAAVRATLAPSIHNTQPWRFVLGGSSLEIHADWNRRLRVLDPRGRQLLISCGCAVMNARVALAAAGYEVVTERFPDAAQPDLVARLTLHQPHAEALSLGMLDPVIERRHTNRRRFADEPTPWDVVDTLVGIASDEGAELFPIVVPEHRLATARLSQQADFLENADPAYRAELRAWTAGDPRRPDGVPLHGNPHGDSHAHDDLPIRSFNTHNMRWRPPETRASHEQCLLLLGTRHDTATAWLRAGEALEHILLEITRRGYAASPITQVIEVERTNALLRRELDLAMYPHVLLRVGRAPATPATRRRRLVDVLEDAPGPTTTVTA